VDPNRPSPPAEAAPAAGTQGQPADSGWLRRDLVLPVILGVVINEITDALADLYPLVRLLIAVLLVVVYWRLTLVLQRRRRAGRWVGAGPAVGPPVGPERAGVQRGMQHRVVGRWRWLLIAVWAIAIALVVVAGLLFALGWLSALLIVVWLVVVVVPVRFVDALKEPLQRLAYQVAAVSVGAALSIGGGAAVTARQTLVGYWGWSGALVHVTTAGPDSYKGVIVTSPAQAGACTPGTMVWRMAGSGRAYTGTSSVVSDQGCDPATAAQSRWTLSSATQGRLCVTVPGGAQPQCSVIRKLLFAERIVSYKPAADVQPPDDRPTEALGPPDYDAQSDTGYVALGNAVTTCEGQLVVGFSTGFVDVPGADLWVWEIDLPEAFEVFISRDGKAWRSVGHHVSGGIDISGQASPQERFRFVRVCDDPDGATSQSPFGGPDIDAVAVAGAAS
jgi:hypothetical protein